MPENSTEPLYKWEALEYEDRKKRPDWFLAVTIIGVCLGAVAIIFHDLLFGVFILISVGTLIMINMRRPKSIDCQITEHGIQIGGILYPFKTVKKFAIIGIPNNKKLVFETERFFMPHHYIAIPQDDAEGIEELLRNYLPYDEEVEEPVAHRIMDRLEI